MRFTEQYRIKLYFLFNYCLISKISFSYDHSTCQIQNFIIFHEAISYVLNELERIFQCIAKQRFNEIFVNK